MLHSFYHVSKRSIIVLYCCTCHEMFNRTLNNVQHQQRQTSDLQYIYRMHQPNHIARSNCHELTETNGIIILYFNNALE